jgi:3-methyl-2-oxobutanoate hydroxymethyltransferase
MKHQREPIAMLTAYDYPTARLAQEAGVHSLLVGDSMGTVILGHESTRDVPLSLMIELTKAVRRGAPGVYLVGDMPFDCLARGPSATQAGAGAFMNAACDAVKLEASDEDLPLLDVLVRANVPAIVHLGLRPQQVTSPDGYKAQARDEQSIEQLVRSAKRFESAGAIMLLLEAVPNEAAAAVVEAVRVPVIGCGAGPACDGHVVVTQDMLGLLFAPPPRFVPVLANAAEAFQNAMREYVAQVASRRYPAPEHAYAMKRSATSTPWS